MDRHQHLITQYQQILTLSEQMLALARDEKWERLVDLEVSYAKTVESVVQYSIPSDVSVEIQEAINLLLKYTLENEAEVRQRLKLRLDKLAILIGHTTQQRELNDSYGRISEYAIMSNERL